MKSKCKHGFDVACLMCGFGEFEGKRVWFDWAWQEQQKRIDELESKVTDFSKNLKDRELAVLVRQERIDAALQELMGAIRFVAEGIGNDPNYIKGTVLRSYARLQKKLKGGDE